MGDYVAAEGPPWVWILATFLLFAVGLVLGALACYVLAVAPRRGMASELRLLKDRVADLEKPEPQEIRLVAPATVRDPVSVEVSEDSGVLPCFPWHTPAPP